MLTRQLTAVKLVGLFIFIAPLLGQSRQEQTVLAQPAAPSSRMVAYRGTNLEITYPDNWTVTKTGTAVTMAPEEGIVSGALAYGMLMDIFEPRNQDAGGWTAAKGEQLLADLTDKLIQDLQRTNPNLRVIKKIPKRVGGERALEVEMTSESPVGWREVNRLTTVMRAGDRLHYLLAVAPQSEFSRYSSIFEKMILSIRFYEQGEFRAQVNFPDDITQDFPKYFLLLPICSHLSEKSGCETVRNSECMGKEIINEGGCHEDRNNSERQGTVQFRMLQL